MLLPITSHPGKELTIIWKRNETRCWLWAEVKIKSNLLQDDRPEEDKEAGGAFRNKSRLELGKKISGTASSLSFQSTPDP